LEKSQVPEKNKVQKNMKIWLSPGVGKTTKFPKMSNKQIQHWPCQSITKMLEIHEKCENQEIIFLFPLIMYTSSKIVNVA